MTIWADIWSPIWGDIWAESQEPQEPPATQEQEVAGGYGFLNSRRQTKDEIDEERQKLGIVEKVADNISQEMAEPTTNRSISPIKHSQEFDAEAIAKKVAKIARNRREAAELEEIARLLAVAARKQREEEEVVLRMLWRMIA